MRDKWIGGSGTPTNPAWAATLAYMVLFGLNSYPDPERIVTGKKTHDDDFWLDNIRGWAPSSPVEWPHGDETYEMIRCARVPYTVRSKRSGGFTPREYLDHLLVGVSTVHDAVAGSGPWVIDSATPKFEQLDKLGSFLVQELWPSPNGTAYTVPGWQQPSTVQPEGHQKIATPPASPWPFRELTITPDETVRVTLTSNTNERRYLLVGYEGGGAW